MQLPNKPGIYLVTLKNKAPISVNADRVGRAEFCIKVNSENCKIGKANNFAARFRNYQKTFGHENVIFEIIGVINNPAQAEQKILRMLSSYRMKGLSGRANEWLEGVSLEEVRAMAREVVEGFRLSEVISDKRHGSDTIPGVDDSSPAKDPKETIRLLVRLMGVGFSNGHFAQIHHMQNETIESHVKYCLETKLFRIGSANSNVLLRLRYIAKSIGRKSNVSSELIENLLRGSRDLYPFS